MGKKVKEYKSGDFIFAKVKGYPAWPARVQRLNGKKYFVYFYGTGETANLPPNMIFDYAENKDKFLTKTVKRRDFNDGVRQIEHDFANNVPLEQVIGVQAEPPADANDTANDTGNDTMEDSAIDTTAADDDADTSAGNVTQNDTAVEDSDDAGALIIDEGKQQAKNRKSKVAEPAKTPKTPKTPRGKPKKEDKKEEEDMENKEELVSRSGRKIRPKRYLDEQTEENATLPSPAPKKKRPASPQQEKEKENKERDGKEKEKSVEKNMNHFNNVPKSDLEDLKEPFKPADAEKENILIAYLPSGQYIGIKLFQSRPANFKDEAARLAWDKQAAKNALKLLTQLERGEITPQSVLAQLIMDLSLTDEEKASLDKERETEEKKSRVQFLKTEMKLIELDAKIKTCLCLERADTELCLKLLDQLLELDIKPLMLLKHPTCVETVKRMRAYVGNTPSWDLSETEALHFAKQAHAIRRQAHKLYSHTMELFNPPEGISSWEYFSGLVLQFKKATADLGADQLLELVHEPIEMSQPSAVTMSAAVEAAHDTHKEHEPATEPANKKNVRAKKGANSTPSKPAPKRQSSRKHDENKDKDKESNKKQSDEIDVNDVDAQTDKNTDNISKENDIAEDSEGQKEKEVEKNAENTEVTTETSNAPDEETNEQNSEKEKENDTDMDSQKDSVDNESNEKDNEVESAENAKENSNAMEHEDVENKDDDKQSSEEAKNSTEAKEVKENSKAAKEVKENSKEVKENNKEVKETSKKGKNGNDKGKKGDKSKESSDKIDVSHKKDSNDSGKKADDDKEDEPRAKRARGETKKTDPPPRSPAKRKAKV